MTSNFDPRVTSQSILQGSNQADSFQENQVGRGFSVFTRFLRDSSVNMTTRFKELRAKVTQSAADSLRSIQKLLIPEKSFKEQFVENVLVQLEKRTFSSNGSREFFLLRSKEILLRNKHILLNSVYPQKYELAKKALSSFERIENDCQINQNTLLTRSIETQNEVITTAIIQETIITSEIYEETVLTTQVLTASNCEDPSSNRIASLSSNKSEISDSSRESPQTLSIEERTQEESRNKEEQIDVRIDLEIEEEFVNLETEKRKVIEGGEHTVFWFEKNLKGLIFKAEKHTNEAQNKEKALDYVRLREKARSICKECNLFLLHIPYSSAIRVGEKYFIVEEMIEGLKGGLEYQEGFYNWVLSQPELEGYAQELFRQLTILICKLGFSDVKYNNIPICINGKVILVDLDELSALLGLAKGRGGRFNRSGVPIKEYIGNGLLNYIPEKFLDICIEEAKQHLSVKEFDSLKKYLNGEVYNSKEKGVEQRIKRRERKRVEYADFLQKNQILSPNSPISLNELELEQMIMTNWSEELIPLDRKTSIISLAKYLIEYVNSYLDDIVEDRMDLQKSRTLEISVNQSDLLWAFLHEKQPFWSYSNGDDNFLNNISFALFALKKSGAIHDYRKYKNENPLSNLETRKEIFIQINKINEQIKSTEDKEVKKNLEENRKGLFRQLKGPQEKHNPDFPIVIKI